MLGHIWGHLRKTPYTHVLNAPKRGHMALTENAIKAAQPKDKAYRLADSGGLYLEVSPKGQKYWRFKYRFAGKEKRLSIGVYNPDRGVPTSLKEARRLHNEARLLLESGIDPSQKKRLDKLSRHLSAENTFQAVAKEWYEKKMTDKAETHQTRTKRLMEKDLFPYFGSRPINEILPREVLVVLHKIENRGAVDTAHRAKGVAGQIFRYGVATGRCDRDPTQDLKGALRERNKKHFAAITDTKGAGQLMLAIDRYEGGLIVKSALYLSALLFQRPGEIRHMEWAEIDWENNQWEIPREKIKTRKKMQHKPAENYVEYVATSLIKGRLAMMTLCSQKRRWGWAVITILRLRAYLMNTGVMLQPYARYSKRRLSKRGYQTLTPIAFATP